MDLTEENNITAILVFIDFEKAFNSIEWCFIENTLNFFNFGSSIQRWTRLYIKTRTVA